MEIHRASLTGKPVCGSGPDKFGRLRVSTSGVGVTCPNCKKPPMTREAALAAIHEAAKQA